MTTSQNTAFTPCSHKGCDKVFANHRWGQIKAHDAGWFVNKQEQAWCPAHLPEWTASWRAEQKKKGK